MTKHFWRPLRLKIENNNPKILKLLFISPFDRNLTLNKKAFQRPLGLIIRNNLNRLKVWIYTPIWLIFILWLVRHWFLIWYQLFVVGYQFPKLNNTTPKLIFFSNEDWFKKSNTYNFVCTVYCLCNIKRQIY